jgi:ABC-type transport system substrate-binding protein
MNAASRFSRRTMMISAALGASLAARHPGAALGQEDHWRPGDGLRIAGPTFGLASLDPALVRDLQTDFLVRQVFRGVMAYDDDMLPVPALAQTVMVSDDAMRYTITLRDDARFQDGRRIEPEDLHFSWSRALMPATAGGDASLLPASTYLGDIDGANAVLAGEATDLAGVGVVDERTVEVRLARPSATFPMKLAATPASILDRHGDYDATDWWLTANGSGPYRIEGYDDDGNLRLAASDAWPDHIAVRDVTILLGLNASMPENLFQRGEVDLVDEIPAQLVPLMADPATDLPPSRMIDSPRFAIAYIAMGNQHPPLDDPHVRRAIQYAFPASRYALAAFDGQVGVAEGVIPPGVLGRDWPAVMPGVDVEAAKAEIAASRYGRAEDVPPIRIHAADIGPVEALRDVVGADLGLTVEAVQVGWIDFLDGLAAKSWDAYSLYWGMDYPDPEAILWVLFGGESSENYTGYRNPEFDSAMIAAREAIDAAEREALYETAQQALIDDAAIIPLYAPVLTAIVREGMQEVPLTPLGLLSLETIR